MFTTEIRKIFLSYSAFIFCYICWLIDYFVDIFTENEGKVDDFKVTPYHD